MSLIKDEERLELLKEIGGTKVYEERRRDSLKVMHETEGRRAHIEEVVSRSCLICACVLSLQASCSTPWPLSSCIKGAGPAKQTDCVTVVVHTR